MVECWFIGDEARWVLINHGWMLIHRRWSHVSYTTLPSEWTVKAEWAWREDVWWVPVALPPWGYSVGVVKCDTAAAAYLSKESGRRRPGCQLCRAHMSKWPPARPGAYHGCNLAWGLDFARGMDESWPQRQREASRYLLFWWRQLAKAIQAFLVGLQPFGLNHVSSFSVVLSLCLLVVLSSYHPVCYSFKIINISIPTHRVNFLCYGLGFSYFILLLPAPTHLSS